MGVITLLLIVDKCIPHGHDIVENILYLPTLFDHITNLYNSVYDILFILDLDIGDGSVSPISATSSTGSTRTITFYPFFFTLGLIKFYFAFPTPYIFFIKKQYLGAYSFFLSFFLLAGIFFFISLRQLFLSLIWYTCLNISY